MHGSLRCRCTSWIRSWPTTSSAACCSPPGSSKSCRRWSIAGRAAPSAETAHIAELRKRAAEADAKLKRLYDAIENGIADVSDLMLKEPPGPCLPR